MIPETISLLKKYTLKQAKKYLPTRKRASNKTHGGKCLVIAGSKGLYGSSILTALAAGRVGSGYIYIYSSGKFPIQSHPEFLTLTKLTELDRFNAIAIGPGFKDHKTILSIIKKLKKIKFPNVVLDAEAINAIAKSAIQLPEQWIVTPHEGELARVLNVSSGKIRSQRKKYLELAHKKLGCIVLLKGFKTLLHDGKSIWEIQSGNPALAKAGTGDVLTGMIAGFLSQDLSPSQAALLASYIHGDIADAWIRSKRDHLGLLPSDILDSIPYHLKKMRK